MAVCTPRREASGGTGPAPTLRFQPPGLGGINPSLSRGVASGPGLDPQEGRGPCPRAQTEGTCHPVVMRPVGTHNFTCLTWGVGLKLLGQARSGRSQASSVQTCGPPSLPLPPGCHGTHSQPGSRAQSSRGCRVSRPPCIWGLAARAQRLLSDSATSCPSRCLGRGVSRASGH